MNSPATPEQMRAVIQARTKRARTHCGRTQAEMAKLLGVTLERYKKWENRGNSVIQAEFIDLFCTIVQMPQRDLLSASMDANDRAVIDQLRRSA